MAFFCDIRPQNINYQFDPFLLYQFARFTIKIAIIWIWLILLSFLDVFKIDLMPLSCIKISIKDWERLPLHISMIFGNIYAISFNLIQSFAFFQVLNEVTWSWLKKNPSFLNFSPNRGCDLKVIVPIYQNYDKKSLNQEKLAKFAFAQVLWEILDFHFSGPKIKKFNNNQKFLKHPDFSTLEYNKWPKSR